MAALTQLVVIREATLHEGVALALGHFGPVVLIHVTQANELHCWLLLLKIRCPRSVVVRKRLDSTVQQDFCRAACRPQMPAGASLRADSMVRRSDGGNIRGRSS